MFLSMHCGRLNRNLNLCRTLRAFLVLSASSLRPNTSWNKPSAFLLAPVGKKKSIILSFSLELTSSQNDCKQVQFFLLLFLVHHCVAIFKNYSGDKESLMCTTQTCLTSFYSLTPRSD